MKLPIFSSLKVALLLTIISCSQERQIKEEVDGETIISIEAESFVAQEGNFEIIASAENGELIKSSGGWLEYHIEVPEAGRYQFEVKANKIVCFSLKAKNGSIESFPI